MLQWMVDLGLGPRGPTLDSVLLAYVYRLCWRDSAEGIACCSEHNKSTQKILVLWIICVQWINDFSSWTLKYILLKLREKSDPWLHTIFFHESGTLLSYTGHAVTLMHESVVKGFKETTLLELPCIRKVIDSCISWVFYAFGGKLNIVNVNSTSSLI